MDNNTNTYIKTDNNIIINEECIRWARKKDDCMELCIKLNSCVSGFEIHKVCKLNNPNSYNKLNYFFNEK